MPTRSLNVAGLFAGVGGLERGMHLAGHRTTFVAENDEAARAVLERRFPEVEFASDVREVPSLPAGTDVLTAGFPCQDLSSVGRKEGIDGSRSCLVDEVFRLLRARPVEWVVLENVRFMLHLAKGAAMRRIADGFEALGYRWAYRVVNSHGFGLPHRRHRVFFVASREHDPRPVLLGEDAGPPAVRGEPRAHGFYWTEGTYASGLAADAIPPLKGGSTVGIPSPPAILFESGEVAAPEIRDAERLQGFPAGWTEPARDVTRDSMRWRLLGNAVSVPVAHWLGERLTDPAGDYDDSADAPVNGRWPTACWSLGDGRFASNVSDHPIRKRRPRIATFLRYDSKPLSRRAVTGFLRRADAGRLRYPDGFLDAIRRFRDRLA